MTKIVVYHGSYGCETGCCGHYVEVTEGDLRNQHLNREYFDFFHPRDESDKLQYAKDLITQYFGKEHVEDIDWENCLIYDYDSDPS